MWLIQSPETAPTARPDFLDKGVGRPWLLLSGCWSQGQWFCLEPVSPWETGILVGFGTYLLLRTRHHCVSPVPRKPFRSWRIAHLPPSHRPRQG